MLIYFIKKKYFSKLKKNIFYKLKNIFKNIFLKFFTTQKYFKNIFKNILKKNF